jgi:hypothetical protein
VQAGTETFTDGYQTVKLRQNGRFTAELHHNEKHRGTYTKEQEEAWTIVTFSYDGETAYSQIIEDILLLPEQWQDEHSHNSALERNR